MEGAAHEHAVLLGGDLTLAPDANATGVTYDLTDHVFGSLSFDAFNVSLATADGPLGDVIRPDVGCHRGWSFTVTEK